MSEIDKNMPVTLRFQVGEAQIPLTELLNLSEGSVIEGDPIYTYFPKVRAVLNDRLVAEGELVKIGDKVGFRITKIA